MELSIKLGDRMGWYRRISNRYSHAYTPKAVNRVMPITGFSLLVASIALLSLTKLHDWGFGLYGVSILAWSDYISVKLAQHKVGIIGSLFVAYGLFAVVLGGAGLILLAIIFGE
ncbi:hypothetical protein [Levilactobacillus parabrevis]|uniref:hypothetical protein n=2 Tax=Levilactobacillus parabrevis TaxID=357278 RepID=UPI0021A82CE4|nr:hypothetical protein [Levilactobacillus parabrevis]MCT4489619.1 hypothetical protein [Levilactobacillus parabrevis]